MTDNALNRVMCGASASPLVAGRTEPTTTRSGRPQVALVHDYLTQRGGAERVVVDLLDAFPGATVHTSLYYPDGTYPEIDGNRVHTMPLNRVKPLRRLHRFAFPILSPAWSRFRVDADVVLCSSSGWAHGVATEGRKVVYCHAPPRWLHQREVYLSDRGQRLELLALSALHRPLKSWDRKAARTAHRYLANSGLIRDQIKRVYGIEAELVPPAITMDAFAPQEPVEGLSEGFVLCVSRLMAYKNVNVIIEAVRGTNHQLVIVGDGPESDRLKAMAPSNVRFLGRVDDAQLRWLYARCSMNASASYEDFGLVTVEAACFGKPTVGLRYGGFLDTVVDGETGLLIDKPHPAQMADAIDIVGQSNWSSARIAAHAATFGIAGFRDRIRQIVDQEARLA